MIRPALVQMFLSSAYLCVDPACATVANDSSCCPRCHSAVLSLAAILNRETEVVADAAIELETARVLTH